MKKILKPKKSGGKKKRKRDPKKKDKNPGPLKKRKITVTNSYSNINFIHVEPKHQSSVDIYTPPAPKKKRSDKIIIPPPPPEKKKEEEEERLHLMMSEIKQFNEGVLMQSSGYTATNSETQRQLLRYMEVFPTLNGTLRSRYQEVLSRLEDTFNVIQKHNDLGLTKNDGVLVNIQNFPSIPFTEILYNLEKSFTHRGSRTFLKCVAYSFDRYRKSPCFHPEHNNIQDTNNNIRDLVNECIVIENKSRNRWLNIIKYSKGLLSGYIKAENMILEEESYEIMNLLEISKNCLQLFNVLFEYCIYDLDEKVGKKNAMKFMIEIINPMILQEDAFTCPMFQKYIQSIPVERYVRGKKNKECPRLYTIEFCLSTYNLQEPLAPYTKRLKRLTLKKIWYTYLDVLDLNECSFTSIHKYLIIIEEVMSMLKIHRTKLFSTNQNQVDEQQSLIKEKLNHIYNDQILHKAQKKKRKNKDNDGGGGGKVPKEIYSLVEELKVKFNQQTFIDFIPQAILNLAVQQ